MSSPIETVTEFIKVLLKMFLTQTMIGTHYKSSKVADERMYMREYGVRLASFDCPKVVSKSVFLKSGINRQAIGADYATRFNGHLGELYYRRRIDLFHGLQLGKPHIFRVPFVLDERNRNEYGGFVGSPSPFLAFRRGSNEQFVHFHRFGKLILGVPLRHGTSESLKHGPSRNIIHTDLFRQQQGRIPALVRGEEEDSEKPALQRGAGLVKDRPRRRGVEIETSAALIHPSRRDARIEVGLVALAARHSFRPAHPNQMIFASRLRRKGGEEVHEVQRLVRIYHPPTVSQTSSALVQ